MYVSNVIYGPPTGVDAEVSHAEEDGHSPGGKGEQVRQWCDGDGDAAGCHGIADTRLYVIIVVGLRHAGHQQKHVVHTDTCNIRIKWYF